MRNSILFILNVISAMCLWNIIAFLKPASFWAFRALRTIFWFFILGFGYLIVGKLLDIAGVGWAAIILGDYWRPVIYNAITVIGLLAGNIMLYRHSR